jgi:hypothetical protein
MKKFIKDILSIENNLKSAILRMEKYTNKKSLNECWEWSGTLSSSGYGKLSIGGRHGFYARASRISYYLTFGEFNEELYVCHKCDNPLCVNSNHLFLGTAKENTDDMYIKERQSLPPINNGEQHGNHKLTEEEVLYIYNSYSSMKELAFTFNVTTTTIHRILTGKAWKHLNLIPKTFEKFIPEPKRFLSEEDVKFIRNSNLKNIELAIKFNYDPSSISKIKKYKSYKHIL